MTDSYVWTRRPEETDPAYAAFREYLDMGSDRALSKVAATLNKSMQLLAGWSSKHSWVERVRAFDQHVATADTDGLVHQLAESRDKNLALMDKLRDHLSRRLDEFIERNQDPSVRWTQALTAMAKVEQNSLLLGKETGKTSDGVARVEKLVERIEALSGADE